MSGYYRGSALEAKMLGSTVPCEDTSFFDPRCHCDTKTEHTLRVEMAHLQRESAELALVRESLDRTKNQLQSVCEAAADLRIHDAGENAEAAIWLFSDATRDAGGYLEITHGSLANLYRYVLTFRMRKATSP